MLLSSCEDFWDTLCNRGTRSCQPSQFGKLVPRCALSTELEGTNWVCVLQALHWSTLLGLRYFKLLYLFAGGWIIHVFSPHVLRRKNYLQIKKSSLTACLMHRLCHSLELGFMLRAAQIRKANKTLNKTETKTNKGSVCYSDELI